MKIEHFCLIACEGLCPSQVIVQKCTTFPDFVWAHSIQAFVSHAVDTTHRIQRLQAEICDKANRLRIPDTFQACQQSFAKMWMYVDSRDSGEIDF